MEVSLLESFESPDLALNYLKNHSVDLIFLDIEMPNMSGFDFIKSLHHKPAIVLFTSKTMYAFEGFEHEVVDFLIKPVELNRLRKAVEKVCQQKLIDKLPNSDSSFTIKSEGKFINIKKSEIIYIQAMADYVSINYFKDGQVKKQLYHATMKKILTEINYSKLIKTHRSFIVNTLHINTYSKDKIILQGNIEVPISASLKNLVFESLGKL